MREKTKDVEILRASIRVITQVLTESDIQVTQTGVEAYTRVDSKTGKLTLINLPYLPDDASEELIMATQGFLDHEVGHGLFSNFAVADQAKQLKVAQLQNVIEDIFVERKMAEKFKGSAYNLNKVRQFYIDKYVNGVLESGDENHIKGTLAVTALRALAGQEIFAEFMQDKWHLIEEIKNAAEPLAAEIARVNSSEEGLQLAVKIKEALNKPESPQPPSDDDESDDDEGESGQPPEDESDDQGDNQSADKDDQQEDRNDDSDGEGDDEQEEQSEDDTNGDGEGEGNADGSSGAGDDDDESEGDTGSGDADGDGEGDGDSPANNEQTEEEAEQEQPAAFDIEQAMSDSGATDGLTKAFNQEVAHQAKTSDYVLFTDEGDKLEPLPERYWASHEATVRFEGKVAHMTGPIQKDLERAVVANSRSTWESGRRSGRIHGAALSRLATGDSRIFRKKTENTSKDVDVSLVVDCSGSMSGPRIRLASQAAMTLSVVLERLGINHEVIGFTTRIMPRDLEQAMYDSSQKYGIQYARHEALYMPVFKQYGERVTIDVKRRLAGLEDGGFLSSNVDGESIDIAARRLMAQKGKGKIMIVLSDGQPACWGDADFDNHLKSTVKQIEAAGINTVGIGINSHAVERYYSKSLYVDKVEDLPTVVAKQLKTMLLRK